MNTETKKIASTLAAMIRVETVNPQDGVPGPAVFRFHTLLKELFPALFAACETENFDGTLLMRWPGRDAKAMPVLLMNHMDVVAAEGEWEHPPFGGEMAGGKLWGRGTLDTKGGLCCMLYAANALAEAGFVPAEDVYFESSANEETSGSGARAVAAALEARGLQFAWILDEGGMIMEEPIGGAKGAYAMVGMGERGASSLRFVSGGSGGHASAPGKNTPLVQLGRFMAAAEDQHCFTAALEPTVREMLRRLSVGVSGPLKFIYGHPDFFAPLLKVIMPRVSPTARALTQTTVAFTMAQGSACENVIPAEAWVVGNMRVSPHQGFADSLRSISALAAKYGLDTEVLEAAEDIPVSDYDTDAFRLLESAVSAVFPGTAAVPYLMTGASDCRSMSRLSANCYRFVPFSINAEEMSSIHGLDERVSLDALAPAVEFYTFLLKGGRA